ncbi:VOC family protein [Parapedobacter pyrenivorans]|uniref:VOC family protein n=1 Tax=Parapedobacter pyrenivorans TaxID=1305674 RepID=UPI0033414787
MHLFTLLSVAYAVSSANAQHADSIKNQTTMKLNAGVITEKLAETKSFYTEIMGFGVTFENEFYLLLHTPDRTAEISFLLPNHPSQQPLFQAPFQGQGVYLTIEVDDVDAWHEKMIAKGVTIKISLRDEPWGDRHFAIEDPNGIGIDIVKYSGAAE